MADDQYLLTESLAVLRPYADELVAEFAGRLATGHPTLGAIFEPRLLTVLLELAATYDRPQRLLPALATMGRRYRRYGAGVEDYAAVGGVLLGTLRDFAGAAWTPAHHGAWVRAYAFAAASMMPAGAVADEEDQRLAA